MENNKTKKFYFGHYWQVYATNSVDVPADFTIEQAIKHVKEIWKDIGLPSGSDYVQDSDEPDFDCCDFGIDANGDIIT